MTGTLRYRHGAAHSAWCPATDFITFYLLGASNGSILSALEMCLKPGFEKPKWWQSMENQRTSHQRSCFKQWKQDFIQRWEQQSGWGVHPQSDPDIMNLTVKCCDDVSSWFWFKFWMNNPLVCINLKDTSWQGRIGTLRNNHTGCYQCANILLGPGPRE